MKDSPERAPESLFSRHGARLITKTAHDFEYRRQFAIHRRELQEDVIYEARATSRPLEREGISIAFDVIAKHIHEVRGFMASTGFRLVALNDDFQPVPNDVHTSHMQHITWRIPREANPIEIKSADASNMLGAVKFGYLLRKTDTLLDELTLTAAQAEEHQPKEVPPLSKQRPHPLYPTGESNNYF